MTSCGLVSSVNIDLPDDIELGVPLNQGGHR